MSLLEENLRIFKSKYNHTLYHIRDRSNTICKSTNLMVELDCISSSYIFDKNGKRYMEVSLNESTVMKDIRNIQVLMNNVFETNETLSSDIIVKVPYRYGKFEIKVIDLDNYMLTTEDIKPNTRLRVILELSSVYDFGVNWIVRKITVLKE